MTNIIPQISKQASIFTQPVHLQLLYFYMAANCDVLEDEIICAYPSTELRSAFKNFGMVVEELMMQNMVLFRNRRYILGDTDLFINTQCPFNPEIEKLKQFYHELSESPRIASIATQKWHSLEGAYLHNSSNIKSGHTIAQIFSLVYFLVYGEDYRPYTGKEIGQFNSLFRFFGGVSSVKMIVMYVSEAVNPNPGQLLIQKDKIYHKACQPGKKATSIKSTIGSHEEAFK